MGGGTRTEGSGARTLAAALVACALLGACAGRLAAPEPLLRVRIPWDAKSGPATTFMLTVSAAGMDTLRAVLVPVADGLEAGLRVPAGDGRRFTAEALDDTGRVLYRGSVLVDVRPVRGLEIAIDLAPAAPMLWLAPHFADVVLETPFVLEVRASLLDGLRAVEVGLVWDPAAPVVLESVTTAPELAARGLAVQADGARFTLEADTAFVAGDGTVALARYRFATFDGWDGALYPLQFDLDATRLEGPAVPADEVHRDRAQLRLRLGDARARLLDGGFEDSGQDVAALPAGGYAVAGFAAPADAGPTTRRLATLHLLDAEAAPRIRVAYGDAQARWAEGVAPAPAGGVYLAGRRDADGGFLLRADAAGSVLWEDDLGFVGAPARLAAVAPRPGGGAVAVGSHARGDENQPLVTVWSPAGREDQLFLPGDPDRRDPTRLLDVLALDEHHFVAVGTVAGVQSGSLDEAMVLARFAQDPALRLVWLRRYDAPGGLLLGRALAAAPDGGFLLAGWIADGSGSRAAVVRTDADGAELWRRSYGAGWEQVMDAAALPGGGWVLAGQVDAGDPDRGTDVSVRLLGPGGEPLWQRIYGGRGVDTAHGVCLRAGGGYVLTGATTSGRAEGTDLLLLVLDPDGRKAAGD